MPAVEDAHRGFGCFDVKMHKDYPATHTMALAIKADSVYDIRGGKSYVKELTFHFDETYKSFLDRVADKYQFEVKWIPYENHPESVEYYQSWKNNGKEKKRYMEEKQAELEQFKKEFEQNYRAITKVYSVKLESLFFIG